MVGLVWRHCAAVGSAERHANAALIVSTAAVKRRDVIKRTT